MDTSLITVIFYSLIGGIISLVGGLVLLSNKKRALEIARYATPFAAGALLASAFLDLLSEASHLGNIETALLFALIGMLGFFLLERTLRVFHHHHADDKDQHSDPTVPLIVIGDTIHNFIDGIAIAAGFLVDPSVGIAVTLAVAAHEIPQEIGDFGLLLNKGVSRKNVLLVNITSALATTIAATTFFLLGDSYELPLDIVLGLVAGMFIYIAASDIIPSIHSTEDKSVSRAQTMLLLLGVVVVGSVTTVLHDVIDQAHDHDHSSEHSEEEHHGDDEHEDEDHKDEHSDEDHDDHKEDHSDDHNEDSHSE